MATISRIFFTKTWKKTALKVANLKGIWKKISTAPTAQNSLELKIHIRNVAQDTSVDYSGVLLMQKQMAITFTFIGIFYK